MIVNFEQTHWQDYKFLNEYIVIYKVNFKFISINKRKAIKADTMLNAWKIFRSSFKEATLRKISIVKIT